MSETAKRDICEVRCMLVEFYRQDSGCWCEPVHNMPVPSHSIGCLTAQAWWKNHGKDLERETDEFLASMGVSYERFRPRILAKHGP